jgi:acetyltransferase-like isoleucine patch superfamily enzyme
MNESIYVFIKSFNIDKLKYALTNRYDILSGKINLLFIKKQNIGKNSFVDKSVQVLGWQNIKIGNNSIISEDTWLNVNQRGGYNLSVIIGDHCFIGRRNFLSSGSLIKIGNYCLTGPNCNFLGSDHIYNSPFIPYIASGTTQNGIIEIGSNCWLGSNVTILKNVKVGYGSIIGASTVVNKDIPPLSIVVGNPCKIIKRFDMRLQTWVSFKDYSEENEQYLLSEDEYLKILNKTSINMKGLRVASSNLFGDI